MRDCELKLNLRKNIMSIWIGVLFASYVLAEWYFRKTRAITFSLCEKYGRNQFRRVGLDPNGWGRAACALMEMGVHKKCRIVARIFAVLGVVYILFQYWNEAKP
jgi:hypothetical protein